MPNETIKLTPRYKMAHDIYISLFKIGFDEKTIQDFLNNIDDADVVEVVHGEWVEKWDSQHFVSSCFCSVCGKGTHRDSLMKWAKGAYCQNCDAKMDGERRSE